MVLPAVQYLTQAFNPDNRDMKGETGFRVAAADEKSVNMDMKAP